MKWHLNDLLDNLSYEVVLDIGGSTGLAKKFCIKREVKTVYSIDTDRTFVDINGILHDRIPGIKYSEYDKGQSF